MPLNFKQALISKNFIQPFNRWFFGATSLLYLWLAFSVTWTRTMRLIVLASYAQWGLVHLIECKRKHSFKTKLPITLDSTLVNLAILLALLLTFGYATLLLFAGGPNWRLLQQLIVALMICACLFGANLIVLKRLITLG